MLFLLLLLVSHFLHTMENKNAEQDKVEISLYGGAEIEQIVSEYSTHLDATINQDHLAIEIPPFLSKNEIRTTYIFHSEKLDESISFGLNINNNKLKFRLIEKIKQARISNDKDIYLDSFNVHFFSNILHTVFWHQTGSSPSNQIITDKKSFTVFNPQAEADNHWCKNILWMNSHTGCATDLSNYNQLNIINFSDLDSSFTIKELLLPEPFSRHTIKYLVQHPLNTNIFYTILSDCHIYCKTILKLIIHDNAIQSYTVIIDSMPENHHVFIITASDANNLSIISCPTESYYTRDLDAFKSGSPQTIQLFFGEGLDRLNKIKKIVSYQWKEENKKRENLNQVTISYEDFYKEHPRVKNFLWDWFAWKLLR